MLNGRFVCQPQSGVQRFCSEMAMELTARLGPTLQILMPQHGGGTFGQTRQAGHLRGHPWEQLELPRFKKHGYLINLGNTAPIACSRQLVVIHDAGTFRTPEAYGWRFRQWYRLVQFCLTRNGTTIATVSESSRKDIAQCLRMPERKLALLPEGTDHLDRIDADQDCLSRLNLQPRCFVLAVGNLAAHKNLPALSALARMLPTFGIELVVAGHLKGDAFSQNGLAGLPQPARYIGRVTDAELKALYQAAACYVFPSRYEGYGLPAAEAMRCGCPVIAADIPALRETCGDAALYADPNSPATFANAAALLLQDEGLRAGLISKGLARTRHRTWAQAARCLLDIVERDLNRYPLKTPAIPAQP